jgi:flagellar biosynthetic protein FliR
LLTFSSAELNTWMAALIWPLTRILGLIAAAPLFGNSSVPVTQKIALGLLLAIIIAPIVPALPAADPFSMAGLLIVLQELLVGLAMGFSMRIVFAAVEMAGEVTGMTMGLGFATFFDPQSQGRSSAISQFLALLATLAFLAANAHLVLLSALAESFSTLPIAATPLNAGGFAQLANWGGQVFAAGVQLALPIIAALLVVNIALGILTRAAPQLNLFGIGFPITLATGFFVLMLTLPYLTTPFEHLFNEGIEMVRKLPRQWHVGQLPPAKTKSGGAAEK